MVERTHVPSARMVSALLFVAALVLAWPASVAEAATFVVNDTRDIADPNLGDGRCDVDNLRINGDQCTLRAAIQQANAIGGSHGIVMIGGRFSLTIAGQDEDAAATGDLDVTAQIAIVGQGPQATSIHGGRDAGAIVDRVFDVRPGGSLTLSQLTVGLGTATPSGPAGGNGGGIRNAGGSVTLNLVEVVSNTAREFSAGGTIVGGNGAGIANETVAGAGGILNAANVTFTDNRGDRDGGAIFNNGGTMSLTNVTVSGNVADNGAAISTSGPATLSFVTIAGNEAFDGGIVGGLDVTNGAAVTIRGSIVTDNRDVDCRGRVTSGGSNVFEDDDDTNPCFASLGPGDVGSVDLDLLDLQDNGGLVRTRSPKHGDPVIDGVVPGSSAASACPSTDARGIARPQDGDGDGAARCDVGAHELRTFRVNATDDFPDLTPGDGTCDGNPGPAVQCFLRAAIQEANALPDPVAVLVPAGTHRLSRSGLNDEDAATGDLDLKKRIAIFGAGSNATTIDGGGLDRVFDAQEGSLVRLAGLRITGGDVDFDGGGVRAIGFVRILDSVVDGNTAFHGGAIATRGSGGLSLTRVSIRENGARSDGGGVRIVSSGTVTIVESAIVLNRAERSGGGLQVDGDANVVLQNVTVSGNRTPRTTTAPFGAGQGGGIAAVAGSLRLTNVTIAENRADSQGFTGPGQGLRVVSPARVRVDNSIIGPNGVFFDGRRLGENCSSPVTSRGNNVGSDTSCGLTGPGDVQGVDPGLAPLNANGGPSLTHALLVGSPAIDRVQVDPNLGLLCIARDQRGRPRPVDGNGDGQARCDSGAFEVQNRPCEPRPPVIVTVTQAGGGRVNVSISPTLNEGTSTNGLRRVQFGPTTRATLDLGELGTSRGNVTVNVPLPGTFGFTIIPDGPGVADLAPFVVFDDCGGWSSFAGAGPTVTGQLGTFAVQPSSATIQAGQTVPLRFSWTVPAPGVWRSLKILQLRLVDETGANRFWLRWAETGDRYSLLDASGQHEIAAGTAGAPLVLARDGVSLALAATKTVGSGPTGPSVTLELPLRIAESLAGRSLRIEVAAENDAGATDPFTPAGLLAVAATGAGPSVSTKPPDDDDPRRLTAEQRQQRRRSDHSSLDDTRIEGDVVAVDAQASPPTITIASRDGDVTLRLHGEAHRQADAVRVGDYVQADGEKIHEGLYEITDLDVEQRAPR